MILIAFASFLSALKCKSCKDRHILLVILLGQISWPINAEKHLKLSSKSNVYLLTSFFLPNVRTDRILADIQRVFELYFERFYMLNITIATYASYN